MLKHYVTETEEDGEAVRTIIYPEELWSGNYNIGYDSAFGSVAWINSSGPYSNNTLRQTVFELESTAGGPEQNQNADVVYYVSAFGKSSSIIQNDSAHFGILIKVYYLQNAEGDTVTVEHFFPFEKFEGQWQFVTGSFSGAYVSSDPDDTAIYTSISKIEVICEYSGQNVDTVAYFDNITVEKELFEPVDEYAYDVYGNLVAQ